MVSSPIDLEPHPIWKALSVVTITTDLYSNVVGIWTKIIQGYSTKEGEAYTFCLEIGPTNATDFQNIVVESYCSNIVEFILRKPNDVS